MGLRGPQLGPTGKCAESSILNPQAETGKGLDRELWEGHDPVMDGSRPGCGRVSRPDHPEICEISKNKHQTPNKSQITNLKPSGLKPRVSNLGEGSHLCYVVGKLRWDGRETVPKREDTSSQHEHTA